MDIPTPIFFQNLEFEINKEKIKVHKDYIIKMNNKKYKLTIINKCIQLKINDINNLNIYYYQNKYTLKNMIDSL